MAALLLLGAITCAAQPTETDPSELDAGWLSAGIGYGIPYEVSVVASVNIGRERFWQATFNSTFEFKFDTELGFVSSLGAGYGSSRVDRTGRIAYSIGPALVWGNYRPGGRGRLTRFRTVGLVPNLQLNFTPIREVGLGLDIYVVVSPKESAAAIRLVFVIEGYK